MSDSDAKKWYAGAAQRDITPAGSVFLFGYPHVPRMSTSVNDPLLVSAVALGDGERVVVFVACDLIWVPAAVSRAARQRIEHATDVPAEHIMITATHTHSGPVTAQMASNLHDTVVPPPDPDYVRRLEDVLVASACQAIESMRSATLEHSMADGSPLGTNRHHPEGPAIPDVPVLSAREAETGEPIAIMCVCSMHPTVLHEDSTCISGDFPGLARLHLQETHGLNCPVIYHMGAAGNQSPRYVVQGNTLAEASRLGRALADAIVDSLSQSSAAESFGVAAESFLIQELPLRHFPASDQAKHSLASAEQCLAKLRDRHAPATAIRGAEVDVFGAEETYTLAKLAARHMLDDFAHSCLPAEVQVLRVGDMRFVGWPGEVFVEFALELMNRHDRVSVITLANGDLQGYAVTQEAIRRGRYEAGNALFQSPDAGEQLVAAADALLKLIASPSRPTAP